MNDPTSILLVWLGLGIIMVSYVTYRLISDRKKSSEHRHIFYPLTSNPGDKMFPGRNDTIGWVAYIFMIIGVLAFLSMLLFMIIGNNYPQWLIHVFGLFFYSGLFLQVMHGLNKRTEK